MSPLSYLLFTRFKNQIKGIFRSPAKLIYAVILIALMVLVVIGGRETAAETETFRPSSELYAIMLGFYALMLILVVNSGFSTGMSVFKMPDVNFLFAGPFRPLRVLFFGMLQQLGTAIITGLFILFQYGWLHGSYGVSVPGMIAILLGYSFVLFTGQLTAMTIYCLTSGSDKKRRTARGVFIAVCVVWAGYIFYSCLGEGEFLSKLCAAASSSWAMYFPVAGWLCWAVAGVLESELAGLVGLALWAVFCLALWLAMARADQDYYEDVLQSTETAFNAQAAAKEGRVTETGPKNLKLGRTGLGGGEGASAFWYKHRIENRRSRTFILGGAELIFVIATIGFGFFMRDEGVVPVLAFAVYMQMFSSSMRRLPREMMKPYVYLVPEPPFKKLLWCIRESVGSFALMAVLIFVPLGLIMKLDPQTIAACCLVHFTYSYLLLAGNLVCERVFGRVNTRALILVFYFLVEILVCAPGIAAAVVLNVFGTALPLCLLALAAVNALLALLAIFLCRGILNYAELKN
ncbi:MAG: putative ABC exporter domain-containing protein [Oscillospiraceae bacterium]|nr:putative ABC exporter domain-containing protein [Oscillospiraceae bacterium]